MRRNNQKIYIYLRNQITWATLFFFLVLSLIIFGNQFYLVLNQSISKGYLGSELFPLIFFKYARDTPFLFSLSFSMALIYTLNKLYKKSELIVLFNAGIGDLQIFKILFPIIFPAIIFVSFFSIYMSPEAVNKINTFKNYAELRPDFIFFKERSFQSFNDNDLTFYTSKIKSKDDDQLMSNVFLHSKKDNRIILSKTGKKFIDEKTGVVYLSLFDGNIYKNIDYKIDKDASATSFRKFNFLLFDPSENYVKEIHLSYKEKSLKELLKSFDLGNVLELIYRFSIPFSLLLMSFLSVQFSKINPRNKRNFALGYGLITYIIYYNLLMYLRESEPKDVLDIVISFISTHSILFFLIFIIYFLRKKIIIWITK